MDGRSARLAARAAVVVALTGCGNGADDPATPSTSVSGSPSATETVPSPGASSAPPSPSATSALPTPSTTPSTAARRLNGMPVYYVGESQRSFRLFREFRTVDDAGTPVLSAVRAATGLAPLDPDYLSPWRPARRLSVRQEGSTLRIDLSADAFSRTDVGSELAVAAVQQLVHTATAAAAAFPSGQPVTSVTITMDGKATDAWGVVRIGRPMARAPMAEVQAHAWVTSPQEGEVRRAGDVAFTGFGTSFEATFGWVVRSAAGAEVARGSAMGGTGTGGFGTVRFTARLDPGRYTVTLSTDDPSGGAEGRGPATDDKTFSVR